MTGILRWWQTSRIAPSIHARDTADQAQVEGRAVFAPQLQPLAEQHVGRLEIQVLRRAAQFFDPACERLVRFLGQHAFDDLARRRVGKPPPLQEPRLDSRLIHGLGNGRAATVDDHRQHADGLHEHQVQQDVPQRVFVFQQAATQLDHRRLAAKFADPAQGFDQHVGFFDGCFQVGGSPPRIVAARRADHAPHRAAAAARENPLF